MVVAPVALPCSKMEGISIFPTPDLWENYLDTEENSLLYTPNKKGLINNSIHMCRPLYFRRRMELIQSKHR
jgi:hypothetical protein